MELKSSDVVRLALNSPAALPLDAATEVLRAGLGGWVSAQLPPLHPLRAELVPQRMAFLGRHLRVRAALVPLLRAWHEAGVEAMLIKGFAHAEFLHADPAHRFYGDVDLLIHERDAWRAVELAVALGWHSDGLVDEPQWWTHEVAHLFSPDGQVRLDVHREINSSRTLNAAKGRRVTRQFWRAAQLIFWQGTQVWMPDPRDQMVLLALTRAWSGDRAHLKPADFLDDRALQQRHHFTPTCLEDRAATLGCLHTWRAFRRSLDGLSYGCEASAARVRCRALLDGHMALLGAWPRRLRDAPQIAADVLRALPYALAVKRDLARGGDVRTLTAGQRVGAMRRGQLATVVRVGRGTRLALRLVYPKGATCLPRALTTYRALADAGLPVSFVSGVGRGDGGIEGHAWVEYPELLNQQYGEPQSAQRFGEIYRHSAERP